MSQNTTDLKGLAITTTPVQPWKDLYYFDSALKIGTIFPALNMPFYKAEDEPANPLAPNDAFPFRGQESSTKADLISQITCITFALNDLTLFLDTHPKEEKGIKLYNSIIEKRNELLKKFAKNYYPLTQDSSNTTASDFENFSWSLGPAPWEGEDL